MLRFRTTVTSILLASIFFWWPISAIAGWQFTHWGMTSEEVVQASQGKAVPTTSAERAKKRSTSGDTEPLLTMPWQSGQFSFAAFFHFDHDGRLSYVDLELENSALARDLEGSLRVKYGPPDSETDRGLWAITVWRTPTEQVSYMRVGEENASVQYKPRQTKDNEGL